MNSNPKPPISKRLRYALCSLLPFLICLLALCFFAFFIVVEPILDRIGVSVMGQVEASVTTVALLIMIPWVLLFVQWSWSFRQWVMRSWPGRIAKEKLLGSLLILCAVSITQARCPLPQLTLNGITIPPYDSTGTNPVSLQLEVFMDDQVYAPFSVWPIDWTNHVGDTNWMREGKLAVGMCEYKFTNRFYGSNYTCVRLESLNVMHPSEGWKQEWIEIQGYLFAPTNGDGSPVVADNGFIVTTNALLTMFSSQGRAQWVNWMHIEQDDAGSLHLPQTLGTGSNDLWFPIPYCGATAPDGRHYRLASDSMTNSEFYAAASGYLPLDDIGGLPEPPATISSMSCMALWAELVIVALVLLTLAVAVYVCVKNGMRCIKNFLKRIWAALGEDDPPPPPPPPLTVTNRYTSTITTNQPASDDIPPPPPIPYTASAH